MRLVLVLAALLALTPAAQAWSPFSNAIEPAQPRVGDVYSYRQEIRVSGVPAHGTFVDVPYEGEGQVVIDVLGPDRVEDGYGRLVDADGYRIRQANGTSLVRDETCFAQRDSWIAVRREFDHATPEFRWRATTGMSVAGQGLTGGEVAKEWAPVLRFDARPCDGATPWAGQRIGAGEEVGLWSPPFTYGFGQWGSFAKSRAAQATAFGERDAMLLEWDAADLFGSDLANGTLRITLADGLPGVARVESEIEVQLEWGVRRIESVTELVGFERGDGAELTVGDRRGQDIPDVGTQPWEPRRIDDRALDLPFPFEQAYAAAVADPRAGLADWLGEHPDAFLAIAIYERHLDSVSSSGAQAVLPRPQSTDGGWFLGFRDGDAARSVVVYRQTGAQTPLGELATPRKVTIVERANPTTAYVPDVLPETAITSETLVERLAQVGKDARAMESYVWIVGGIGAYHYVNVFVSDIAYMNVPARATGETVSLDGESSMLYSLATTTYASSPVRLVGGVGGVQPEPAEKVAAALGGPTGGLTAGALGLAVLLLVAKFLLVPLFTRLRRDRLLDNPVRARLYERVRAEPGIHLAALAEFAGIGESPSRHHVEQLVRHRYLVEVDVDGMRRYYAAGEVAPDDARRAAVLRSAPTRAVYDLYAAEPTLSLREAARRLGSSAPGVHRLKKKLEKEGLLPAAPAARVELQAKGR